MVAVKIPLLAKWQDDNNKTEMGFCEAEISQSMEETEAEMVDPPSP